MPVWVRAEVGGRLALCERSGPDIRVGRDAGCDLRLAHPSVAPLHTKVLVRRGRVLVVDLGQAPRGTVVSGRRIDAPVVLEPGEVVELGEVRLHLEFLDTSDSGPSGYDLEVGRVGPELEGGVYGVRRFPLPGGRELCWSTERVDVHHWRERVGSSLASEHVSQVVGWTSWRARPCLVEQVPPGVRLRQLLRAEQLGWLTAPLGARVLIVAHLARALSVRHGSGRVHGALSPDAVQIARDGRAILLAPGPVDPPLGGEERVSAARRHGASLQPADDRLALAQLGARELRLRGHSGILDVLQRWAGQTEARLSPTEVLETVRADGVDPAASVLVRLVRVVESFGPPTVLL